eukprot:scaffold245_cov256-Pinguiococcus_pyrenoidosus.AAC.14
MLRRSHENTNGVPSVSSTRAANYGQAATSFMLHPLNSSLSFSKSYCVTPGLAATGSGAGSGAGVAVGASSPSPSPSSLASPLKGESSLSTNDFLFGTWDKLGAGPLSAAGSASAAAAPAASFSVGFELSTGALSFGLVASALGSFIWSKKLGVSDPVRRTGPGGRSGSAETSGSASFGVSAGLSISSSTSSKPVSSGFCSLEGTGVERRKERNDVIRLCCCGGSLVWPAGWSDTLYFMISRKSSRSR